MFSKSGKTLIENENPFHESIKINFTNRKILAMDKIYNFCDLLFAFLQYCNH